MKRILMVLAWLAACQAETIPELIQKSLQVHPDLRLADARVQSAREDAKLQGLLSDPVLSLGVNDILVTDPAARDREPMQTQSLQLSQKFPLSRRLGHAEKRGEARASLEAFVLEKRRLELAYEVRKNAYTWLKLRDESAILNEYVKVFEELERIHTLYNTESSTHYEAALESRVKEGSVRMRLSETKAAKTAAKAALTALMAGETVVSVEGNLAPEALPELARFLERLKTAPMVQIAARKAEAAEQGALSAQSARIPDLSVSLGYYQREAFDDYLAVGFSLPLNNLYGRAEGEEAKAKQEFSAAKAEEESLIDDLTAKVTALHATLASLKEQQKIQNEVLRAQQAILDGLDSRVQSRQAPLKSRYEVQAKLLESRLKLIELQYKYRLGYAGLIQLTGEE